MMEQNVRSDLWFMLLRLFTVLLCLVPVSGMAQGVASIWALQDGTMIEYRARFGEQTIVERCERTLAIPLAAGDPHIGLGIAGPPRDAGNEATIATPDASLLCEQPAPPLGHVFVADSAGRGFEINEQGRFPDLSIPTGRDALTYAGAFLYLLDIESMTITRVNPQSGSSEAPLPCTMNTVVATGTLSELRPVLAGGGDRLFTVAIVDGRQHIVVLNTAPREDEICDVVTAFSAYSVPDDLMPGEFEPEDIIGLAFNGRRLFAMTQTGRVYEGDAATGFSFSRHIDGSLAPPPFFLLPEGGLPTAIASQVVSAVFTLDLQSVQPECPVQPGRIVEVDTFSGNMVPDTICLPEAFSDDAGLAYSGHSLFFINGSLPSPKVYELSLTTGMSLMEPFDGPSAQFGIAALAFSEGFLYALDPIRDSITKFDPKAPTVLDNSSCVTGLVAEGALAAGREVNGAPSLVVATVVDTIVEIGQPSDLNNPADCRVLSEEYALMDAQLAVHNISGLAFNRRRLFVAGSTTQDVATQENIFAYRFDDIEMGVNTGKSILADSPLAFSPVALTSTHLDEASPNTPLSTARR